MKSITIKYLAAVGAKVKHRESLESGVIACLSTNEAGNWYHVVTDKGASIGWWHETDLQAAPKSMPARRNGNGERNAAE